MMFAAIAAAAQSDTLPAAGRADSIGGVGRVPEVVVTGTRSAADLRHLPMTVSVVDRTQLESRMEQSLLPSLTEQVPGLFVTSRGVAGYGVSTGAAGGMSLRGIGGAPQAGLPTTGLLVLIDGHPQYMGLMGHPIADACRTMMAERVEVVRGPASVLYGSNAMGGVINIVTRKMPEEGVKTSIRGAYGSYNTVEAGLANTLRRGRFGSVISASYDRTDGHRDNMSFEEWSGYAKLSYDMSAHWNAYADLNVTQFDASNPGSIYAPVTDNDQDILRGMVSMAVENRYDRTSGALSLFYNWGRHKIDDGYAAGSSPLDYLFRSRDLMTGVSLYQSVMLFAGNRITLGVDYLHFGGESWNIYDDGRREDLVDKSQNEVAAYVDWRQAVGPLLTIDAGVRVDRHSQSGTEWVPQAGVALHLPGRVEMKAMVSKGFRNPTIREMYMFRPANPDLRPERLWNYELSVSQQLAGGALRWGVNLFYIDGDNLIMRMPVDSGQLNVNTGRIENWGAEAEIGWRISPAWSVEANYSWLHMENPVLASPEHKLYFGGDFARGRWSISTGVQYVAGLYTLLDPVVREEFVLWNLRCTFRIGGGVSIFARGENLLAQNYEINAGYPMPRATVMAGAAVDF